MKTLFSYLIERFRRYTKQAEAGQALSEYGLMIGGIGIVLAAVMGVTVAATGDQFRAAACDLINDGSDVARCTGAASIAEGNRPPEARIMNTHCLVNEDCPFTGKNVSYDPDGDEADLTCEWVFEDIGTSNICEPTDITPNWSEVGFKQVTLTVTDAEGLSDSVITNVQVTTDGPNQPPVGVIDGPGACIVGQPCGVFEFLESTPLDEHTPLSFEWTAQDGTIMAQDEYADATNIVFNQTGTDKKVEVTVTDNAGAENTFDFLVSEVRNGNGNNPPPENPIARINPSSPVTCTVNQACGTFDGSGSTDPDGDTPLTYMWSIQGINGSIDSATASQSDMTFTQEGTATVELVVTDSEGNSSTADTHQVTVEADNPGSGFTIEGQAGANAPGQNQNTTNFNLKVTTEQPSTDVTLRIYVTQENASDTYSFVVNGGNVTNSANPVSVPETTVNYDTNLVYYELQLTTNGSGERNINGTINHSNAGTMNSANDPWAQNFPSQAGFQPITTIPAYIGGTKVNDNATLPRPPHVNFNVDNCTVNQPCNFYDASTGQTGTIQAHEWDFNNDGTTDVTGQPNPTNTYTNPGTYTVRYLVRDSDGLESWITKQVQVNDAQNNSNGTLQIASRDSGDRNEQHGNFRYRLTNTGQQAQSNISVRFYFTPAPRIATDYVLDTYWDSSSAASVNGPIQVSNTLYYFEVQYSTSLAPGDQWELHGNIRLSDWQNDQTPADDFWRNSPTTPAYQPTDALPVFVNGQLVTGQTP